MSHETHWDAATRELIAQAEARGAERERERITGEIESAALHVMATADSDEGARLTAAILDRAARIARTPEATR